MLDSRLSTWPSATLDGFATHTFPKDGLVALSRMVYDSTPLFTAQIRPGVVVLAGAGGNITVIGGSREAAIVDTGYASRVAEIKSKVTGAHERPPRWVVNTHWHFDHTDGNSAFAAAGATILGHANCRGRLSTDQHVPSLSWQISASPRAAWPSITFDQPLVIDVGTEELQLLPQSPAHTDGDVAVLLPSANVLITGDLFTHRSYPVIDESSRGSLRGMIEAVDRLLPLLDAGTIVVPGHGAATDRTGLVSYRDMLRTAEDRILAMIEAGRKPSEIATARPTADFDSVWGRGYVTGEQFIRMALGGMRLAVPPLDQPTTA